MQRSRRASDRQQVRDALTDLLKADLAVRLAKHEAKANPEALKKYNEAGVVAAEALARAEKLVRDKGTRKDKSRLSTLLCLRGGPRASCSART
jgi:hypothetical protein